MPGAARRPTFDRLVLAVQHCATFDIFDDPRFKGKTSLTSQIGVNILIAGVIGGWAKPLDPTDAEMETASEIFTKML